ncbi:MAG TPA: MMPL family transporter, partial [Kribbellaceae bacterium]
MAIPVLSISLGTADSGTAPSSTTQRKAYDLMSDAFGPGMNGPLLVVVDQSNGPDVTAQLVHDLRDDVIPAALAGTQANAYVGGSTAANEDIATKMSDRLPYFLLFVVGILFLVIAMAFRSVVVAIKAAL